MANLGDGKDPERTRTVRAPEELSPAGPRLNAEPIGEVAGDRYRLEHEVGSGGIGRVLQAKDLRLDRLVAIKCLRVRDEDAAARFRREAMITARLGHPAIVPVHDIGTLESGDPFYAMKLVAGETLFERIAAARTAASRMALVPNVVAVAEAMAFAHSERIVHRDLKPANVLVGKFGETVLIDWGLAKRLGDPELSARSPGLAAPGATVAGTVMGTPVYMAPEQLRGLADERSDVYALGAMLYHVVSGAPPYRARGAEHLRALERGTPPPRLPADTPRELCAIVDKAMAADPAARYPTALELAEDLRRFVAGQLVGAYQYSLRALVARWVKRNRAPVTVGAVLLAALAATAVFSVQRIVRERNVADARTEALKLSQARASLERDPTAAVAWLKEVRLDDASLPAVRAVAEEARGLGVASALLAGPGQGHAVIQVSPSRLVSGHVDEVARWDLPGGTSRRLATHVGVVSRIAVSRDGRRVVSGGHDGVVRLADLETGAGREVGRHQARVTAVLFIADGRIVSAGADGYIVVWPLAGGAGRRLSGHEGPVGPVLEAGDRLISAGSDGTVRLWSLDGAEPRILTRHGDEVNALALSPDGTTVYSGGYDGAVRAVALAGGEPRTLAQRTVRVLCLSASGSGLAAALADGTVEWIEADGAARRLGSHAGIAEWTAISPDGEWLATGGADATVRLFGLRSGASRILRGHRGAVNGLSFAPDGSSLASIADDREIRVWPLSRDGTRMARLGELVVRLVFHPDGRGVAAATSSGAVVVWDGQGAPRRLGTGSPLGTVAVAADGRVAAGWKDGTVRVWRWSGEEIGGALALGAPVTRLAFSPDGTRLAAAGADGKARVVTLETRDVLVLEGHERALYEVLFDPAGRRLVTAGTDAHATLWDLGTGESRRLDAGGTVFRAAFTSDGERLVAGGEARALRVFDVNGAGVELLPGHTDMVLDVELDAAGRWLASAGFDQTVRLWDLGSRPAKATAVLRGHRGTIFDVAVAPDGSQVASVDRDGMVRVWSTATGTSRLLAGHEGPAKRVAFSPDGALLATAGDDGTLRLWPAHVDQLPADARALADWLAAATSAAVVDGDHVRTP